jgi:hypothetical protein
MSSIWETPGTSVVLTRTLLKNAARCSRARSAWLDTHRTPLHTTQRAAHLRSGPMHSYICIPKWRFPSDRFGWFPIKSLEGT